MPGQSAAELIRRADELKSDKGNWENLGQVASKYCLPHKAKITQETEEGNRVSTDVYDATAIDASQIAAAGLQAFLVSPSARFFAYDFEDQELNEESEAKDWLQEEQDADYAILNNSNWNEQIAEWLHDLVVLPGATIYSEEDPDEIIRFTNIPFKESLVSTNAKGDIDELHRMFEYTVRQAFLRWGKACGNEIAELYQKGKWGQRFDFLHSVGPRHDRDVRKINAQNMPFFSVYSLVQKKRKIVEGGYEEFPYAVGRWRVNTGETWGYSPAITALPDILMLNEQQKTLIIAGQQAVGPAWLFPDENFILPLNFNQNAINYAIPDMANPNRNRAPIPLVSGANIPVGIDLIKMYEERIRKYFFTDLFLPLLEKQATAFEVAKVIEKRMTILGAVVGGITNNIGNILARVRRIRRNHPAMRGRVKPVPGSVPGGARVKINYISPLAIAQKAVLQQNLEAFLFAVSQMMQINTEVRHKVKWDKAVDQMARNNSISSDILTNANEYEELVQADRQMQAQAQQLQMAGMVGEAMDKGGKGINAMTPKPEKAA